MTNPDVAANHEPETILCDTSFVSIVQKKGISPDWPEEVRQRLDNAVLAINIVTLAELRAGHIEAEWGARRREEAESLIASYLLVPLDMRIVDECARLRAACKRGGIGVPDNDIWIAATANTRSWALASC